MSKQMIKRKDGSYSQRGLWDNIRANKGSGKRPTKAMLKQEKKIKSKYALGGEMDNNPVQYPVLQSAASSMQNQASNSLGAPVNMPQEEQPQSAFKKGGIKNKKTEIMKTMYKKAGKAPKKMRESFLEESKEIHFGNPPKGKKKFAMGGPGDPPSSNPDTASSNTTQGQPVGMPSKEVITAAPDKYAKVRAKMSTEESDYFDALSDRKKEKFAKNTLKDAYEHSTDLKEAGQAKQLKEASGKKTFFEKRKEKLGMKYQHQEKMAASGSAPGTGFKNVAEGTGNVINAGTGLIKELKPGNQGEQQPLTQRTGGKRSYMGGGKSMAPGGGGRFAAMVGELKGKGKSAEQAAGIAASAGRKKYGKSKFQAMAAAGKARMGGKKC